MKIVLGLKVGIKRVSILRTFVEGPPKSILTWRIVPAPKGPLGLPAWALETGSSSRCILLRSLSLVLHEGRVSGWRVG